MRGEGIYERNHVMSTKFLYASGIILLAAMVAFFFVNSLAHAFHIRLNPEASVFLACCMLIGSIVSITAANVIVAICKEKSTPPLQ